MVTTNINLNITGIENNVYTYPNWWEGVRIPLAIKNDTSIHKYDIDNVFNLEDYTPYYVSASGNDSNDGLSKSSPKATISSCLSDGAELIYMLEGVYYRDTFIINIALSGKDLIIIGLGDVFLTQAQAGLTWTLTSNNTYKSARSAIVGVIDSTFTNAYGYRKSLDLASSITECENTPGTYYTDDVDVWVHTEDERIPDSDILPCLRLPRYVESDDGRLYLKNLTMAYMEFQNRGVSSSSSLEIYYKNIVNPYGSRIPSVNSFRFYNFKLCVTQECIAINPRLDGFNYHNFSNVPNSNVVEIDCQAYNAGINDSGVSNQCSSAHGGIKILRIGGSYYGGDRQTIADVNIGTQAVFVGCELNTGDIQTDNTNIYLGVDADFYGCKLLGNKIVQQTLGLNGVTIKNGFNRISGTSGDVTIN